MQREVSLRLKGSKHRVGSIFTEKSSKSCHFAVFAPKAPPRQDSVCKLSEVNEAMYISGADVYPHVMIEMCFCQVNNLGYFIGLSKEAILFGASSMQIHFLRSYIHQTYIPSIEYENEQFTVLRAISRLIRNAMTTRILCFNLPPCLGLSQPRPLLSLYLSSMEALKSL